MRVALDMSVLGDGYADARGRTGVFRATEGVVAALAARADLDLRLVSGHDLAREARARNYAVQAYPAGVPPFVSRWRAPAPLAGVMRPDSRWRERARASAFARAVWSVLKPLTRTSRPSLVDHRADVYHSLWDPLPPIEQTHARVRVLTLYDLVPLILPECVEESVARYHHEIRASFRSEHDWLVCPSASVRDELVEHLGVPPARVILAPLAADARFHPEADAGVRARARARYGLPDAPYLLSVATIEPRKNLAHLIECFSRVVAETPGFDLHLVLVGREGWKTERMRAAHAASAARRRIHFAGYVADEDLSAIYSGARAFAYMSLYEGFGLPVLEAMQCGTPVLASDRSSLPEVVGDAGVLIDPTDADALCQAIVALVGDTTGRAARRLRGLARAAEFSWSRCADRLVEGYRRALASA